MVLEIASMVYFPHVYLLWPSDAIWRPSSGSALAQSMACFLKAPSQCCAD